MFIKAMHWINVVILFIELNILWLLGFIAGFFFAGLVPSTRAVLKLLNKQDLFTGYYSYSEIFQKYWQEYIRSIKIFQWRVIVFPILFSLFYVELVFIQQSSIMRAYFQWPILIMMSYLLLVLLNLILATEMSGDSWLKKIAFSLVSPIVLPGRSLMCVVMILSFAVLSLAYHWFFFVASPLFLYVASKCLISGYQKKGLLRSI